MNHKKRILNFIKNPTSILFSLNQRGYLKFVPDEQWIKYVYKKRLGNLPDLKAPKTFTEKLQWLKLYDRKPEYSSLVDKYEVRNYIERTIGKEYLIPLLGVYDTFEEIDFDALPDQFVLKPNHTSGDIYICKNKSEIDYKKLKKIVNIWLRRNYYWVQREWPYKNIKPRILCEQYMVDDSGAELKDYKVYCFQGEPKIIKVDFHRFIKHRCNIYDINWNYIPLSVEFPTEPMLQIKKPPKLPDMLRIAQILSKGYPYIRSDFYVVEDKIYFGELTFYPGAGLERYEPKDYELYLGNLINLPINASLS